MKTVTIRAFAERKYAKVPINRIRVLNSRKRSQVHFQQNVRSIEQVGLRKPVVVNERHFAETGRYDLVCGEGRYLAYKALGHEEIPAEVVNCTDSEALLYSLVENIARVPPGTMWFAWEVKRMHDAGLSLAEISRITGKSEAYVGDFVNLVEQGEERLIKGVEDGVFPMAFATRVARSDNGDVQHILMDAFDSGIVSSGNLLTVRKIIETRMAHGKTPLAKRAGTEGPRPVAYSVKQLKSDIRKLTKDKQAFINEAGIKENRLLSLLDGLQTLWQDSELVEAVVAEGLGQLPQLKGDYNVQ